jgi:hypothetical protein
VSTYAASIQLVSREFRQRDGHIGDSGLSVRSSLGRRRMLFHSSDIEPPIAFRTPRNFDGSWTCTSGSVHPFLFCHCRSFRARGIEISCLTRKWSLKSNGFPEQLCDESCASTI